MADPNDNPKVRPDLGEIATTLDGRDITRGYLGPLLISQDTVLRTVGGDLRMYEEVLRDDQVMSTFQQRRLAVISEPWEVVPGGKRAIDKAAADFISETLNRIGFDNLTEKMLMGVFLGYSVAECLWATDGKYIALDRIKVRKARRFRFAPDETLRMLTYADMWQGEVMPPKKFWAFACGADNDDEPYGLGLAHWLYWPVFFKKNGIKLWLKFLDKFAQPTAMGTYPRGSQQADISNLLSALQAINTDTGIAVPEGMAIELLEAARSGTADYVVLHDRMNQAISKVVLGQMMTSEAAGGHNKAEVQMQVRQDLVKADADLICDSFRKTVATWLTEWNFHGAEVPLIRRVIEEPEDLKAESERDLSLYQMGYRPTLKYIETKYGGEWTDIGAPQPVAPTAPQAKAPEFAEAAAEQDELSLLADDLASDWEKVTHPVVQPILELAAKCESYEEFNRLLPEMIGEMDSAALVELLAQGQFAANVWGRINSDPQ
jgi:phage gp29-like protein